MGSSGKVIEFKAPSEEKAASAAPSRRPASRSVRRKPTKRVEPAKASMPFEVSESRGADADSTGALSKAQIHAAASVASEDDPGAVRRTGAIPASAPAAVPPKASDDARPDSPERRIRHALPHVPFPHVPPAGKAKPSGRVDGASEDDAKGEGQAKSLRERIASLQGASRKAAIALACVVVALAFLYVPARNYYVATRDAQELAYKLDQTNSNNETLRGDVNTLETQEGIEDAARKRGYVKEGETAVSVEGVDDSSTSGSSVTSIIADDQSSIPDLPWYASALDAVFFYRAG